MRTSIVSMLMLGAGLSAAGCLNTEDEVTLGETSDELAAPDPEDPQPKPKPDPSTAKPVAPALTVVSRGTTELKLSWTDRTSIETGSKLYRSAKGGAYQLIGSWGKMNGEATQVVQTGLSVDSSYCYYMTATNANGTSTSPTLCTYTRDLDTQKVVRAQLRVKVANIDDADTEDTVWVKLNPNNKTYLDYGRDDFERGSLFAYDLDLGNVREIEDIHEITFEKSGSDGVCLESLELLINDAAIDNNSTFVVFEKKWGATTSTCLWLDNDGGRQNRVTIPHEVLRTSQSWYAPMPYEYLGDVPNSLVITRQELESRIESIVGNVLPDTGGKAHWGKLFGAAYVETSRTYDGQIHVDLDLAGSATLFPDPEIDIDFDLVFSTKLDGNGYPTIHIKTREFQVKASFDWYIGIFNLIPVCGPVSGVYNGPGCITALETYIEQKVQAKWQPLSLDVSLGANGCPAGVKASVSVTTAGDVMLQCQ